MGKLIGIGAGRFVENPKFWREIKNFIRAFSFEPFYPPFFYIGKKKMLVVEEKLLKKNFFLKTPK